MSKINEVERLSEKNQYRKSYLHVHGAQLQAAPPLQQANYFRIEMFKISVHFSSGERPFYKVAP